MHFHKIEDQTFLSEEQIDLKNRIINNSINFILQEVSNNIKIFNESIVLISFISSILIIINRNILLSLIEPFNLYNVKDEFIDLIFKEIKISLEKELKKKMM